jgi:hypothetical protein
MHPLTRTIARHAGRRAARPAATLLLRRNPWVFAALTLGPPAISLGKAAWRAWNDAADEAEPARTSASDRET